MTRKQFKKMAVFARRMARHAVPEEHRERCAHWVDVYLAALDDDGEAYGAHWRHVEDWSNSARYTEEERKRDPWGMGLKGDLLCDWTTPHYGVAEHEPELSLPYPCDENGDEIDGYFEADTPLLGFVTCCLRAGCDVAMANDSGVLGFTMGDIRAMWPRRATLPRWVKEFWESPETIDSAPAERGVWL